VDRQAQCPRWPQAAFPTDGDRLGHPAGQTLVTYVRNSQLPLQPTSLDTHHAKALKADFYAEARKEGKTPGEGAAQAMSRLVAQRRVMVNRMVVRARRVVGR
jgi:hypothetical protein